MSLFEKKLNRFNKIIQGDYGGGYNLFSGNVHNVGSDVLQKGAKSEPLLEGNTGLATSSSGKVSTKVNFLELEQLFGTHKFSFNEPRIGPHPDFQNLGLTDYEKHYAVSMFIDIKGSTRLANRYDLLKVRLIKDTILSLAIEVCSFFGGHIQRLQGDGVFVYFVRREMYDKDAMINALNAASLLNYFMKYEVAKFFEQDGVKAPGIRIGIDYGSEEKTLWSYYGLDYCNELTTTGLHTDLAAKLQSKASYNGVMIGQNLVTQLDLTDKIVSIDNQDPYIHDKYKKYKFEWEKYLDYFDFFHVIGSGQMEMEFPEYCLKCEISALDKQEYYEYRQNLYSIPKDYKMRFTLQQNGVEYQWKYGEEIKWEIYNTGKEAGQAGKHREVIEKAANHSICEVDAKYLGHHTMRVRIKRSSYLKTISIRFPVFVR